MYGQKIENTIAQEMHVTPVLWELMDLTNQILLAFELELVAKINCTK